MNLIRVEGLPSKIMFVGDYPTQNEYQSGVAYTGSVSNFYDRLLQPYKRRIKEFYRTYLYKVPVTGYESKVKKIRSIALENANKVADFLSIIKSEIDAVEPNVIVAAGELALNALTGVRDITKQRGSILPIIPEISSRPIKVIPILSPRKIWEMNEVPFAYTQLDLGKAIELEYNTELYKPDELIWIVESAQAFLNYWERAKYGEFLTFDIETHHNFITCISFCTDGREAISVPLLVGPKMDLQDRAFIINLIKEILTSPIPKVNQNIKYECVMTESWGFPETRNIIGDTMLMAGCIYSEFLKGLDFLTSIYTKYPYYKDEGKSYNPKIHKVERLLLYNAKDALVTWQVWKAQQKDAEELNVKHFYFNYVHPTFFIYKRMDQRGIRIDESQRNRLLNKYRPQVEEHRSFISCVAGRQINPLSPKQVSELVYDILGCKKHYHTAPSGAQTLSTDEETLEEIMINETRDEGVKETLSRVILTRKLSKVIQFLVNPVSVDGRMRTSFKLAGTKNGRSSAGESLETVYGLERTKIFETECGGSFQTIPKHGFEYGPQRFGADIRSIFIPSPGYVFVEGDQSQAEARVVCVLAEDWDTLQLFDVTDIHIVTATWITGKKYENITEDERQELGKKPRHAGNYDMSPGRLSQMTHKPIAECRLIMEKFHQASTKIRGIFHVRIREIINNTRKLVSPHGRIRIFFGRVDQEMYKEAYAMIPQATVSDHSKFTILHKLVAKYPEPIAFPLSESHDSLLFEVQEDRVEEFVADFKDAIRTPINFKECSLSRDYNLVIPGEIKTSANNWYEMEKWK